MPAPGEEAQPVLTGLGGAWGARCSPRGGGAPRLSSRLPRGPDRDAGRRGRGSPLCPRPRTPGHDRLPSHLQLHSHHRSPHPREPREPRAPRPPHFSPHLAANPEPTARTWGTPSPATRSRTRCGRPSAGRPRGPRRSAGGHRAPRPATRPAARTAPGREDAAGGPGRPRRPAFLPPINQSTRPLRRDVRPGLLMGPPGPGAGHLTHPRRQLSAHPTARGSGTWPQWTPVTQIPLLLWGPGCGG